MTGGPVRLRGGCWTGSGRGRGMVSSPVRGSNPEVDSCEDRDWRTSAARSGKRGVARAPFAASFATRFTAGALAFAAPPPKKEAMLFCPPDIPRDDLVRGARRGLREEKKRRCLNFASSAFSVQARSFFLSCHTGALAPLRDTCKQKTRSSSQPRVFVPPQLLEVAVRVPLRPRGGHRPEPVRVHDARGVRRVVRARVVAEQVGRNRR